MEGEKRFSIFKATHTHETVLVLFPLSSHVFVHQFYQGTSLYPITTATEKIRTGYRGRSTPLKFEDGSMSLSKI